MALLSNTQQIAIKQEAVAGTAETLAAANVVLHTGRAEWEPDITMTEREAMSASLSPRGSVAGAQKATIRFKQYLSGSYNHSTGAAAAPTASTLAPFDVPFLGCGMAGTVSGTTPNEITTYVPSSTTINDETTGAYCTVSLYQGGKVYKIHGAVGNCVLTFNVGQPVLAEYEFQGCYNAPATASFLSAPVYSAVIEPAFLSATLSVIGSFATAKIQSLKLDFGNQITMRPYPNTATGYFTAQITGRKPVGSFDPEEELVATKDWFADWTAGTLGAITTGTFAGTNYNSFLFTVPNAQYVKVGLGDRDGVATAPIDFACCANSVAGDDEWSLVQT